MCARGLDSCCLVCRELWPGTQGLKVGAKLTRVHDPAPPFFLFVSLFFFFFFFWVFSFLFLFFFPLHLFSIFRFPWGRRVPFEVGSLLVFTCDRCRALESATVRRGKLYPLQSHLAT